MSISVVGGAAIALEHNPDRGSTNDIDSWSNATPATRATVDSVVADVCEVNSRAATVELSEGHNPQDPLSGKPTRCWISISPLAHHRRTERSRASKDRVRRGVRLRARRELGRRPRLVISADYGVSQ